VMTRPTANTDCAAVSSSWRCTVSLGRPCQFVLAGVLPDSIRSTERLLFAGVYLLLAAILLFLRRALRDVLVVGLVGRVPRRPPAVTNA